MGVGCVYSSPIPPGVFGMTELISAHLLLFPWPLLLGRAQTSAPQAARGAEGSRRSQEGRAATLVGVV